MIPVILAIAYLLMLIAAPQKIATGIGPWPVAALAVFSVAFAVMGEIVARLKRRTRT